MKARMNPALRLVGEIGEEFFPLLGVGGVLGEEIDMALAGVPDRIVVADEEGGGFLRRPPVVEVPNGGDGEEACL